MRVRVRAGEGKVRVRERGEGEGEGEGVGVGWGWGWGEATQALGPYSPRGVRPALTLPWLGSARIRVKVSVRLRCV